jgi:hypothetical protein
MTKKKPCRLRAGLWSSLTANDGRPYPVFREVMMIRPAIAMFKVIAANLTNKSGGVKSPGQPIQSATVITPFMRGW